MKNNKLRVIREDVGMSVSELARRAKVSRQTITNIELHGQIPSAPLMFAIADALKRQEREIFFANHVTQELQNRNSQSFLIV